IQRAAPGSATALLYRVGKQYFSIVETVLALAQDPQATQAIGVLWMLLEISIEFAFGRDQIILVQCLESAIQNWIATPFAAAFALCAPLRQQRANLIVVRMAFQKLLE